MMIRFRSLSLLALAAAVLIAACGSDEDKGTSAPAATTPAAADTKAPFAPVVATSELAVGPNRFSLGIIEQAKGTPLPDAQVRFRFFTLQGNQGTLRSEADARFIAPARDAGIAGVIEHRHPDGSNHPHANVEADVGVYVANVQFDQPGNWAVEATFRAPDGREGKVTAPFEVLSQSQTPAVGAPAPKTRNLTARDVTDLAEIDSATQPVPALHQETVAGAIEAGKPALVAFVTPGYCSTRFCGPSYEIVKKLLPVYGDKAAIIHVEVYKDPIKKIPADAVTEWKLQTEPYIFVVDRNGIVTAKFEGPVSYAELDAAMAAVTS